LGVWMCAPPRGLFELCRPRAMNSAVTISNAVAKDRFLVFSPNILLVFNLIGPRLRQRRCPRFLGSFRSLPSIAAIRVATQGSVHSGRNRTLVVSASGKASLQENDNEQVRGEQAQSLKITSAKLNPVRVRRGSTGTGAGAS
jgi:hypothetical protein